MKKMLTFKLCLIQILNFSLIFQNLNSQTDNQINFNPIIPDNIADPSVVMFDNIFYMYATTDIDHGLYEMGIPVVWKSEDFVNWSFKGTIIPDIEWNKPYDFIDDKGEQKTGYFRYWAPGKPLKKDNLYYLFPTIVKPDDQLGTYVMVADNPEGPFRFTNGTGIYFNDTINILTETKPLIDDIDGEPFINEDGKAYIFWRRRNGSALSNDYQKLIGETVKIPTTFSGYSEGPVMFKRNDLYYYIYTLSGHANYCNGYMISQESPLGPFEAPKGKNIFIHSSIENNVWGPGHGNVFQIPETDEYIFLYLEYGEGSTTRQVYANRMSFAPDGSINFIIPDKKGVGYIGEKANKKPNLVIGAKVIASSFRSEKTIKAKIIKDPNALTELKVNTKSDDEVKRIFTYKPENAVDVSNGTRWWAAEDDKNPWLQIDLGEIKKLIACEMAFIFPTFGHAWKLEKSNDGEKWHLCNSVDVPEICSPHIAKDIGKARFLKITIMKGAPGIWEIKVY